MEGMEEKRKREGGKGGVRERWEKKEKREGSGMERKGEGDEEGE